MDVYSRRIIGYSVADNMKAENNYKDLKMALTLRGINDYQYKLIQLETDLVSSEDGIQTGMVEMITAIKSLKIIKSESISMLVYQKLVYQK